LPKFKLFEPVRNLLHWPHRLSGWRLAELLEEKKNYPNIERIACLQQFGCGWRSIFCQGGASVQMPTTQAGHGIMRTRLDCPDVGFA
jgi:hypothetical protein